MQMPTAQYTSQILAAYEAEIAGAAYFDALTAIYPGQSVFLARCAALERATAGRLGELIRKYRLVPGPAATLATRGALEAGMESGREWPELLRHSITSYARYVDEYRALEGLGPAEDQGVLAALTAHEVQLIEWMRAETMR
jgi:hypothetical protein